MVSVDERLDIELGDGRTVRLGGLDVPSADHGAPEIANSARGFLDKLLVGRDVAVMQIAGGTDRWGRTVVDLILDPTDGSSGSTAAALLMAGYARVRPEFETRSCAAERLAIEERARQKGNRNLA